MIRWLDSILIALDARPRGLKAAGLRLAKRLIEWRYIPPTF